MTAAVCTFAAAAAASFFPWCAIVLTEPATRVRRLKVAKPWSRDHRAARSGGRRATRSKAAGRGRPASRLCSLPRAGLWCGEGGDLVAGRRWDGGGQGEEGIGEGPRSVAGSGKRPCPARKMERHAVLAWPSLRPGTPFLSCMLDRSGNDAGDLVSKVERLCKMGSPHDVRPVHVRQRTRSRHV